METPLSSLALVAAGLAIFFAGAALLGEYRRMFLRDPRAVMTTEVITMLVERGGAGYTAIVALIAGVITTLVGCAGFVLTLVF